MVKEEMRRTLESLEFKTCTWEGRHEGYGDFGPEQLEGFRAYVDWQAAVYRSLATSFRNMWEMPFTQVVPHATCAEEAQELEVAEEAQ